MFETVFESDQDITRTENNAETENNQIRALVSDRIVLLPKTDIRCG